jgi:carboxyl-terminal processing protease
MSRKDRNPRKWTYAATLILSFVGATLLGGLYGERLLGSPVQDELQKRMKEYTEVLQAASHWAAEEVDRDKLVYASIDGMLRTLDPHSAFLPPREYTDMQDRQKGTFYGLGILVTKRNDRVTVITPLEGTPAARLGIRAGDIIAEVEGESTDDLPLDEVVRKLKGPKGSTVNIKILRIGMDDLIPLSIVRAAIPTNSISNALMVEPEVGFIQIKDFTFTTVREFDQALNDLKRQGMKKLILDLRSNPGGLLDAAVGVADYFVDRGAMIVYTRGRTPDSRQELLAPGKVEKLDIPVVVLINRGSASASEIVAGAIQDHDRGLVVGETSWGKGLVQSVYSLQYGAGLALTTSKYFTPAGRNIQRDYSSVIDYYVAGDGDGGVDEVPLSQREVFHTDTGRIVYGGGGITPDILVKLRELSKTTQLLQARSAIFNFAVEYSARNPELAREFEITPALLEEFAAYAISRDAAPAADIRKALQDPTDREWVRRQLKAEIVAARDGFDAAFPHRLQGDLQVSRALELFPEAEKLARQAALVRAQRTTDARPGAAEQARRAN